MRLAPDEDPPDSPRPGGEPEPAGTGDARVDDAVSRLAELAELPVREHPAVFEYVHERLSEVLGDLDSHPGGEARGPGGPGR